MPLQIVRRDISKMQVDAIVNTTNREMMGYSGVDLAVHLGAGEALDAECAKIAPLDLGSAKITSGYNLAAKYIIHTAGPVWQGGYAGESVLLRSCYLESLKLAVAHGCTSIAFPLISSGRYGYPKDRVLKHAVQVISEFLLDNELMVYLCVYDRSSYEFSKELYAELSEAIDGEYVDSAVAMPPPSGRKPRPCAAFGAVSVQRKSYDAELEETLQEYLGRKEKTFAFKLFEWIDARGMTDVECYKKANVDKKTFSKIKCNPQTYKPSKQTAVAFAIALRLNLEETQDLLASAGLTLSRSFTFDRIIRFFIKKGVYDVYEINEALFEFDQVLLGC